MNDLLSYLHVARELLLVCRLPPGPPAEANQQTLVLADLLQSTMTTWSLIMQWASHHRGRLEFVQMLAPELDAT
jgi:hypothetical protein